MSNGRGAATSGFSWAGSRFHVWDEDAPTAEAWAHELAAIALAGAATRSKIEASDPGACDEVRRVRWDPPGR